VAFTGRSEKFTLTHLDYRNSRRRMQQLNGNNIWWTDGWRFNKRLLNSDAVALIRCGFSGSVMRGESLTPPLPQPLHPGFQ